MDASKFHKMKDSIEPFAVKKRSKVWKRAWYKNKRDLEGYMTNESLNKWLESLRAVRITERGTIEILYDGANTRYPRLLDELDEYYEEMKLQKIATLS